MILLSLFALAAGFAADYVWVKWNAACSQQRSVHAANWSVLIYFCGCVATWSLAKDMWLPVLAFVIGGWFGTWKAVAKDQA